MPNGRPIAARLSARSRGVPPTAFVLLSIVSVQIGAAIAKGLFDSLGPGGTVFLRISFAALVLFALVRHDPRRARPGRVSRRGSSG